jgi:hypothetical protein
MHKTSSAALASTAAAGERINFDVTRLTPPAAVSSAHVVKESASGNCLPKVFELHQIRQKEKRRRGENEQAQYSETVNKLSRIPLLINEISRIGVDMEAFAKERGECKGCVWRGLMGCPVKSIGVFVPGRYES